MSGRAQTATLSTHLAVLWPRVFLSVSRIHVENPEPSLIGCVTLTRPLDISEPLAISSSLEAEQEKEKPLVGMAYDKCWI